MKRAATLFFHGLLKCKLAVRKTLSPALSLLREGRGRTFGSHCAKYRRLSNGAAFVSPSLRWEARRGPGRGASFSAWARLGVVAVLLQCSAFGVDDYPFKNSPPLNSSSKSDPAVIDPWKFFNRQCTSFVAWRLNGKTTKPFAFHNHMPAATQPKEGFKERWGNAEFWDDHARAMGIVVDSTPAPGAVAHWNPGEGSASRTSGHVAWVKSVNGDGTITIEEYNALVKNGYGQRTIRTTRVGRFIHIFDKPDYGWASRRSN